MPLFFTVLSVFGVLLGMFLIRQGISGDGLGAGLVLLVGIFVVFKEVLDIVFAR